MALKLGDKAFNEKRIVFCDVCVDVLHFNGLGRFIPALKAPYSIVFTESAAHKYFKEANPVVNKSESEKVTSTFNLLILV